MNKEEINGMAQIPNQENILYTSGYVKDLKDRIEDLQKENNKLKETIENVMTLTVCGDKKQIKNTAQYKLEELQQRIDRAIEKLDGSWIDCCGELTDKNYKGYEIEDVIDILRGDINV